MVPRAVMIQSPQDKIIDMYYDISSCYDTYRDAIFMHKSQLESFNTLGFLAKECAQYWLTA